MTDAAFSFSCSFVWPTIRFLPCACLTCRHPSYSAFDEWLHRYSVFFRYVISPSVFGRSVPKSVMEGISGSGKVAEVSFIMDGWQLSLYVDPKYRSISFIVLMNLSDALGPRSKLWPLALEVIFGFGLQAWVISRFLAFVILGV